ncbi:NHLP bacteriocin export ABC transporter permease/ATPase subunit [Luteipulveratus mongoliensis]|uniref:ABC transporter n=1 Tax=Luteipulveratus mongoliensis TaxID=571913 RepID=A0A0K1JFW6_9MICO|nr:NHLP bacteriocin export ABC transporter permease/ATPase subunit [Luteipulveratus mongoliensis]AKU15596.1 hypothetical protein VV02_06560 [Luteipulveratus mongoliensis]
MTMVSGPRLSRLSTWATEVAVPLELADGTVFVFDDTSAAYVLLEGHLDLFAVKLVDGTPSGRWRRLCRIEGGSLIPTAGQGPQHRLVARIGAEASLARLPLAELESSWDQGRTTLPGQVAVLARRMAQQELADAVDRTLTALSAAVRDGLPPREFTAIDGGEVEVEDGHFARTVEDATWVSICEGQVRYGEGILGVFGSGSCLFVPKNDWLLAEGDTRLVARGTADLLVHGELWPSLREHMECYLVGVDAHVATGDVAEAEVLQAAAEVDRQEFGRVADSIERFFAERESRVRLSDVQRDDPIVGALRLVAQQIGMRVRLPLSGLGGGPDARKLSRILHASQAHSRDVLLTKNWYKKDNGPLIGTRAGGTAPVALLRHGSSYYMIDPTGEHPVVEVGRKTQSVVGDRAYQIYPQLPRSVDSTGALIRHGLEGNRSDLIRTVVLAFLAGLLTLSVPIMTGRVLGTFVSNADRSLVVSGALLVMVTAIATAVLGVVINLSVLRVSGRTVARMQSAVWSKVLSLPVSFFERESTGSLSTKVLGVHRSQELLTGPLTVSTLGLFSGLLNLLVIAYYSPRLAPVAAGLVAVALLVCWVVGKRTVREQAKVYQGEKRLSALVLQFLTSIPKLRVSATEDRALREWSTLHLAHGQRKMELRRSQNILVTFNFCFPLVCSIVLFALVGGLWRDSVPTASFLTVFVALNLLIASVLQFTSAAILALAAVPMLSEIESILREEPESSSGTVDPGELSGKVALAGVTFRYGDGPLVLEDVSLTAEPGQFVAIVGPSGSGKSTLLRLILGFEHPQNGSVLFDDLDLSELDVRSVRSQCGVVLQGGGLTPGNIRSNILGTSGLTVKDAWEAAEMAGLKDDIKAMPMGMATVVSEGSTALSGGQRQRLMIARALIARPRMVCFDEATSALDNPTQRIVAESTRRLNATRIVIAHRLSTVADADKIVVLDRGHVVQEGTYDELLADEDGVFSRLARRQMSA